MPAIYRLFVLQLWWLSQMTCTRHFAHFLSMHIYEIWSYQYCTCNVWLILLHLSIFKLHYDLILICLTVRPPVLMSTSRKRISPSPGTGEMSAERIMWAWHVTNTFHSTVAHVGLWGPPVHCLTESTLPGRDSGQSIICQSKMLLLVVCTKHCVHWWSGDWCSRTP